MSSEPDHPYEPDVSDVPESVEWRTIYRNDDPAKVESVWLAIHSMEYPARLADHAGAIADTDADGDSVGDDEHADAAVAAETDERMPTHVQVHAEHIDELREVIDEIAGEQEELDEAIARMAIARQRRQRFIVAVIAVAFLAVLLSQRLFG